MFFIFPENARRNAERQAVEFGVAIHARPRSMHCTRGHFISKSAMRNPG